MSKKLDKVPQERELYDLKWHDYRMLSPDVATLLFINEYSRTKRWMLVDNEGIDPRDVEKLSVLDGNATARKKNPRAAFDFTNLRNWRFWKIFEKLRRWADEMHFRYDFFWEYAFRAHREMKYKFSSPSVFCSEALLDKVLDFRDERAATQITLSELPVFKADNYGDTEIQNDYYYDLLGTLRQKYQSDRVYNARINTLINDGVVSKEFLRKYISKSL